MARTQFTFTFQNAEPGAAVTFSAAVYSSPADQTADGPALALDTSRSVAVWADVSELTATWVDGAGTSIEAEASVDIPVVVETGGVAGASPAPSGGSSSLPVCLLDAEGGTVGNAIGFTDLTTFTWVNTGPSTTAFSVDLATTKVTINEAGLYLGRLRLRNVSVTTAGYVTFDSSASSALGAKRYLGVGSLGDVDVLTIASCDVGDTMVPEEFGDGTLAGTFGFPLLTIVQLAKF